MEKGKKMVVSASELRVFFKDLANATAENQHRVVITRHGQKLVALVSQEDLAFLEKHKPQPTSREIPEPVSDPDMIDIKDPGEMITRDIEDGLKATEGTDDERLKDWRGRAELMLWFRKTRPPMC